jgi:hypothetical protein
MDLMQKLHIEQNEEEDVSIFLNGVVIATGTFLFSPHDVYIENLEVIEERKGYGKIIVDHLKSLPQIKGIFGESVPSAVPFWFKMGADLNAQDMEDWDDEDDSDTLIRFKIQV